MPSTTSGASLNPSSSSQKRNRHDYGRGQSVTEGQGLVDYSQTDKLCHSEAYNTFSLSKRSDTITRSLSGHLQSQPEGIQQGFAAEIVPDPCRSMENLPQFLAYCKKTPEPFQNLKVTHWMASVDGKEKDDALNSRMEEKQPLTTQESAKNCLSSQQQQFQCEKEATGSEQGQRQSTSYKTLQPGLQNPKDSARFHGKCISDCQNNDGITEKGGIQVKISEMIFAFYIPSQTYK
ncbi:hypothetical protein O181_004142 [Austropuccinia psidii MF-1]|uniref:Uncharacterized protein n=1 Tax=Austropuccinia psidii MF-1 TaxID=1389203 RepID=A0A9Q3GFH9_9BASI|nr:hypothetical protein [Austropuccinia psidii MF-1]